MCEFNLNRYSFSIRYQLNYIPLPVIVHPFILLTTARYIAFCISDAFLCSLSYISMNAFRSTAIGFDYVIGVFNSLIDRMNCLFIVFRLVFKFGGCFSANII